MGLGAEAVTLALLAAARRITAQRTQITQQAARISALQVQTATATAAHAAVTAAAAAAAGVSPATPSGMIPV